MKNNRDQMVLNAAVKEAMDICDSLDIPYANVNSFTVNYRAKSRWGQCRAKKYNGRIYNFSININADLLKSEESHNGLVSTVIHELIHTCPNCMKHTGEWKMLADKVNAAYGYRGISITRCKSAEDLGVKELPAFQVYKYAVVCEDCGGVARYKKMTKVVQNPERYFCGKCHTSHLHVIAYSDLC